LVEQSNHKTKKKKNQKKFTNSLQDRPKLSHMPYKSSPYSSFVVYCPSTPTYID
jgi:hypothetical protein